ncbi:RNA polymerase sigma factor [Sphingobacterium multivorum]|uniref:RNA polymerase sigma factor n=1 Tax=Sphingobacterium multivorum TaxID=28454 RepID=UPI0028AF7D73|nr:sigma-70 family RNA polymerase sigma factor [Sphingobacterium multivorum]
MEEDSFKRLAEEPELAINQIMKRYGLQLKTRIRQFIKDDDELVKDVFAETIAAIWADGKRVSTMKEPFAWMMNIAKYQSLNAIRAEHKDIKASLEDALLLTDSTHADTVLDYEELYLRFLKATEQLTPKEKEILLNAKMQGFENKEIGTMYGISLQRVKNITSTAINKIRRALKDWK